MEKHEPNVEVEWDFECVNPASKQVYVPGEILSDRDNVADWLSDRYGWLVVSWREIGYASDDQYNAEPVVFRNVETIHRIRSSMMYNRDGIFVTVSVDDTGLLNIERASGFGILPDDATGLMKHKQRLEVYEWLIEHELATWERIGPEDSEVFATKKLDPERGIR